MFNFFIQHWEILTGIISFISGFIQFLYCKSEKFFLIVNKFLLNYKKYKIPVYLDVRISFTSKLDEKTTKSILKNVDLSNKEYIHFETKINKSIEYNETKIFISIKNRSVLAKIQDDKEIIREKLKTLLEKTNSKLTNIDIDINFEKGENPYEGLFVKKLPIENIKNFSVKLKLDNSLIEAKKDKIKINSRDLDNSLYVLDKLIYLKIPIFNR